MPRNPSEIARLEDEYQYWYARVHNLELLKPQREKALVELRKLERILGIESRPYNGG